MLFVSKKYVFLLSAFQNIKNVTFYCKKCDILKNYSVVCPVSSRSSVGETPLIFL